MSFRKKLQPTIPNDQLIPTLKQLEEENNELTRRLFRSLPLREDKFEQSAVYEKVLTLARRGKTKLKKHIASLTDVPANGSIGKELLKREATIVLDRTLMDKSRFLSDVVTFNESKTNSTLGEFYIKDLQDLVRCETIVKKQLMSLTKISTKSDEIIEQTQSKQF